MVEMRTGIWPNRRRVRGRVMECSGADSDQRHGQAVPSLITSSKEKGRKKEKCLA